MNDKKTNKKNKTRFADMMSKSKGYEEVINNITANVSMLINPKSFHNSVVKNFYKKFYDENEKKLSGKILKNIYKSKSGKSVTVKEAFKKTSKTNLYENIFKKDDNKKPNAHPIYENPHKDEKNISKINPFFNTYFKNDYIDISKTFNSQKSLKNNLIEKTKGKYKNTIPKSYNSEIKYIQKKPPQAHLLNKNEITKNINEITPPQNVLSEISIPPAKKMSVQNILPINSPLRKTVSNTPPLNIVSHKTTPVLTLAKPVLKKEYNKAIKALPQDRGHQIKTSLHIPPLNVISQKTAPVIKSMVKPFLKNEYTKPAAKSFLKNEYTKPAAKSFLKNEYTKSMKANENIISRKNLFSEKNLLGKTEKTLFKVKNGVFNEETKKLPFGKEKEEAVYKSVPEPSNSVNVSPNINVYVKPSNAVTDFNKIWAEIGNRLNSEINSSVNGFYK